jgi:hypothetical protein
MLMPESSLTTPAVSNGPLIIPEFTDDDIESLDFCRRVDCRDEVAYSWEGSASSLIVPGGVAGRSDETD